MRPVAYLLKMYPRFSETFVLNEILELERQGVPVRIYSLKKPDDGVFHADLARVRAPVTYVPDRVRELLSAQREATAAAGGRYGRALAAAVSRRRRATLKHFLRAGALAPAILRDGVGHVHAHFASSAASVALHLNRLTGVPYSITAHAKDIYRNGIDRPELVRKLLSARFVVTVSDHNAAYLGRLAPDARVVRIYNGLELERFTPNGAAPSEPPLVLGVGRLIEKKGFADLIAACARLEHAGRSYRCAIVGKGPLEGALRSMVRARALDGRVELLGPRPQDEVRSLLGRAAVLAAPCVVGRDGNRDGLPAVIVEALAAGVPVVSTPVTGIPEVVEDGVTGFLVPEGDPDALAGAIGRLLDDRAAAAKIGRAGRRRIEADFDLAGNVARLRALFEESAG